MNVKLLSYSMDFTSFLMGELNEKDASTVRNIILFGSAARGDAGKNSDIDLFVDLKSESQSIERKASFITDAFYKSASFRRWKLIGVENRISCVVGRLDRWKDLKPSIISDGIVLFGKYTGSLRGASSVIFFWSNVKPESRRVLLSKRLYGFSQKGRKYQGLVEKSGGTKLGGNCFMVPSDGSAEIKKAFEGLGIQPRVIHASRIG